jgi:polyisoprenoid-binding protein YceI
MKRSLIGWIVGAALLIGGGVLVYLLFFAGGSGVPSTQLTTPEVVTTTTAEGATTSSSDGTATTTSVDDPDDEGTSFLIDSEQTTASFEIGEVLRGEPATVVGTTNQVAGQVVVEGEDLDTVQFSDIVINARTFQTDDERRDRIIRGPVILNSASDEHELITFRSSAVEGLTGVIATPGESYEFTVTGDLTVKGTTNPVTFTVTVEMIDESTIQGSATAEVLRSDFDIGIPSVPFVADVTDEVILKLDFVALAA